MAMSVKEKKLVMWEIIANCVEQVDRMRPHTEDYPGVAAIRFVFEQLATARVEALEPEPADTALGPAEPTLESLAAALSLLEWSLRDRMDCLGQSLATTIGKDIKGISLSLASVRARLDGLEAWSVKFAEWSDAERLVKSPRR